MQICFGIEYGEVDDLCGKVKLAIDDRSCR